MLPSISAQTVYHAAGNVNVTNNFQDEVKAMPLPWIRAISACCTDSVFVFGPDLQTLYLNNSWGTFSTSAPTDIVSASAIMSFMSNRYTNSQDGYFAIIDAVRTCSVRHFSMTVLETKVIVNGTVTPVIDNGRLSGVVLIVRRGHGTETVLPSVWRSERGE